MPSRPSSVELADTVSELMKGVAGWLLIGLGAAGLLTGTGGIIQRAGTADTTVPLLLVGVAVVFIVSGVFVNPRFRRRLDRRHEPSRFGRVRTVEHRTLSTAGNRRESCVVCESTSDEGLVRRHREELVVAGVPLWTTSDNYNVYCPDCALTELSGPPTVGTGDSDSDGGDSDEQTVLTAE